jgi:hypothetical protein
MASHRNTASHSPAGAGRAAADAEPLEKPQEGKDRTASDSAQPYAGRTGKGGAKAERPADSRLRRGSNGAAEPPRDGKIPPPAATAESPARLS